jgi:phosphate transport system permease protein
LYPILVNKTFSLKKFLNKLQEFILSASGFTTTIIMLLIIVFLFKNGLSLFNERPFEEPTAVVTSANVKFNKLTDNEVKKIFDGDITNWKQVGGDDKEIVITTLDEITADVPVEKLGEKMEHLSDVIDEYFTTKEDAICFFSEKYLDKKFPGRVIDVKKMTPLHFVEGKEWFPTAKPISQLGVLPLILGTIWVSFGAILLALPLGLMVAIFLSEIASHRTKSILKPLIELLAGVPSVVYGFFGLVVLVPMVQKGFRLDVGETALSGSIILGIMALPTIISIAEDAIHSVPKVVREASLALGANSWQTIYKVVIPYASSGISAAIILGIGRAMGETMAVLMVTGNAATIPHSFLQPVRTIPATIAAELGEAPNNGLHFKALFALGCILFLLTMFFNIYVNYIKHKNNKARG